MREDAHSICFGSFVNIIQYDFIVLPLYLFLLLNTMPILQVDCDDHKNLCSKFEVTGYPTIKWFSKGSLEPKKYVDVLLAY